MSNNAIETVMGAVVLAVAGGFLYFAYSNSNVKPVEGYAVSAAFSNISGIEPGSSVRIGGIKIGVVENLKLDPDTYRAVATMRVSESYKLPKDSSVAVLSSGLLGEKFLAVEPGGDDAMLADGDKITITQSSVSLEEMIGKFAFSGGGVEKSSTPPAKEPSDAPAIAAPTLLDGHSSE